MHRIPVLSTALLVAALGGVAIHRAPPPAPGEAYALLGAQKVKNEYRAWVRDHEASGGDHEVQLALRYSKGLSREFTTAQGTARLDLVAGALEANVSGLPEGEFDLWLVDNRPGTDSSVSPERSDRLVRAGRLARTDAQASLALELGPELFRSFQVDLVVVTRADRGPEQGLLFGTTSLFQRVYTASRSPELLAASDFAPASPGVAPGLQLGVRQALAAETLVDPDVLFDTLVAAGADLFINGTFNGNGRTCATCHPMARNTTLAASDIDALPDTDPLFSAEFVPALAFSAAGPKFEVPVLMRGAALITENVDGMDDLANKFAMRSIPHTLALPTSLTPSSGDGTTVPPVDRTGWGGDGAPNSGSLRDFATGAVVQHFPLTLGRVPGVDFRLPTDPELNAMEAFQRSLGRQSDLILANLQFRSPVVARGQQLFLTPAFRCNGCHANASANNGAGTNRNFETGVERQVDRPTELILQSLALDLTPAIPGNLVPRDGGFGALGNPTQAGAGVGNGLDGFGTGAFNTPPLIEAADTGPFFHDNSVATIEAAVAFYASSAFANSRAGGGNRVPMEATQIQAIASLLRALNALENMRASRDLAATVQGLAPNQRSSSGPPLVRQAAAEVTDAIEVLSGADLHPEAVTRLLAALANLPPDPQGTDLHPGTMGQVIADLDAARAAIVAN